MSRFRAPARNSLKRALPLSRSLPALLQQYWYIKRGERVRVRGHAQFYATLGLLHAKKRMAAFLEPTHPRRLPGGQVFVRVLSVPLLGGVIRGGFMVPIGDETSWGFPRIDFLA